MFATIVGLHPLVEAEHRQQIRPIGVKLLVGEAASSPRTTWRKERLDRLVAMVAIVKEVGQRVDGVEEPLEQFPVFVVAHVGTVQSSSPEAFRPRRTKARPKSSVTARSARSQATISSSRGSTTPFPAGLPAAPMQSSGRRRAQHALLVQGGSAPLRRNTLRQSLPIRSALPAAQRLDAVGAQSMNSRPQLPTGWVTRRKQRLARIRRGSTKSISGPPAEANWIRANDVAALVRSRSPPCGVPRTAQRFLQGMARRRAADRPAAILRRNPERRLEEDGHEIRQPSILQRSPLQPTHHIGTQSIPGRRRSSTNATEEPHRQTDTTDLRLH